MSEKANIFDETNSLLEDKIVWVSGLKKALDGKSWICPECGRGSRRDRPDGIKQKRRKGRLNWWCPHCGRNMSNVDVIAAAYGITDTSEIAKKLEELFGSMESKAISFPSRRNSKVNTTSGNETQKNYANMYEVQRRALPSFLATLGGKWRALTYETLREAGAGYNVKYKSITLPYDDYTYFWRSVEGKGKGINKDGKRRLYIPLPMKTGKGKINFIMEGEVDALSVKQVLSSFEGIGVAAIGSVKFSQMLIRELDAKFGNCADKPKFIWLGDNDSVKDTEKMVSALNAAGYPAVQIFFADEGAGKVDANQYLQDKGDESLARFLLGAIEDTNDDLKQRTEAIKERIKQEQIAEAKKHGVAIGSLADYFAEEFDSELDKVSTYSERATGFDNLDMKQAFMPGLYILGGSPGTGKTTFVWQLLSQLAEGDECKCREAEHCVFCSYEMSRLELASKSIARELRRRHMAGSKILTPSSTDIRRGSCRNTDEFKAARAKFLNTATSLQVAELSNTTLEELLVVLKAEALKAGDKHLTIAVDYLQLIPVSNPKATAKERVDEVMLALKTFQRETNATLIVISSLNRESNKYGGNSLFSFKESGSIEYSADTVWTLTYDKPEGQETLPRYVELQCAKNRNGATYKVGFDYYAQSDYFCPNTTGKAVEDDDGKETKKSKYRR